MTFEKSTKMIRQWLPLRLIFVGAALSIFHAICNCKYMRRSDNIIDRLFGAFRKKKKSINIQIVKVNGRNEHPKRLLQFFLLARLPSRFFCGSNGPLDSIFCFFYYFNAAQSPSILCIVIVRLDRKVSQSSKNDLLFTWLRKSRDWMRSNGFIDYIFRQRMSSKNCSQGRFAHDQLLKPNQRRPNSEVAFALLSWASKRAVITLSSLTHCGGAITARDEHNEMITIDLWKI